MQKRVRSKRGKTIKNNEENSKKQARTWKEQGGEY
jgi:hypothetical protein